jgi:hypothetical protein
MSAERPRTVERTVERAVARVTNGRSTFRRDAIDAMALPPLPGHWWYGIWTGDFATQSSPQTGEPAPPSVPIVPDPGSFSFGVFVLEPGSSEATQRAAVDGTDPPSWYQNADPDQPRLHGAVTVSFNAVMQGEISMELDSGEVAQLRPGDTMVVLGARKSWWNHGTVPAVVAVSVIGARRAS